MKKAYLGFSLSLFIIAILFGKLKAGTENHPLIGIHVYIWYDPASTVSWEYPKITDKPLIGFYDSSDPTVVTTQMQQMDNLDIDFVMLSWLGVDTFSDRVVEQWYSIAEESGTRLKLAIMVEPYNEEGTYNYTEIYERVYELYDMHENVQMMRDGNGNVKPVIFFYNGGVLTGDDNLTLPLDERFVVMTIGHRKYVDFWYDDVHYKPETVPHGRHIAVLPRFDDFWQWKTGLRNYTNTADRNLTEGLYAQQWERALNLTRQNQIDFITIVSWNEYPERTMIEPHYDATSWNSDPYYLYNMTKNHIIKVKGKS